jgi:hypothetical protein
LSHEALFAYKYAKNISMSGERIWLMENSTWLIIKKEKKTNQPYAMSYKLQATVPHFLINIWCPVRSMSAFLKKSLTRIFQSANMIVIIIFIFGDPYGL